MRHTHRFPQFGTNASPVHGIVPPHLLRHLARQTSSDLRECAAAAMNTLLVTERWRGERHVVGTLRRSLTTPVGECRRTIFDAGHGRLLPGKRVRGEGEMPVGDAETDEAYDAAGATYEMYRQVFGRISIDGRGMRLDSTVHFSRMFDNAFWNGSQMVYGDGDGILFQRFTKSVDVIGHELTHGITQCEVELAYHDQPGAINESISDVFGSLVKQHTLGQSAAEADWLIGAGLFTSRVRGIALRSMKAPGTAYDDPFLGRDPQPAHIRDYVSTFEDNGGVHINSGIPNHAFYLTATALGGVAWEKAGHIWYGTLLNRLTPLADFHSLAQATVDEARTAFGIPEARMVREAWAEVGVEVAVGAAARA
jgi:Zn-dependent metalloprotease